MTEPDSLLTEPGAVIKFSHFSSHPGTCMLYIYIYIYIYIYMCVCVCVCVNRFSTSNTLASIAIRSFYTFIICISCHELHTELGMLSFWQMKTFPFIRNFHFTAPEVVKMETSSESSDANLLKCHYLRFSVQNVMYVAVYP